jgi:hypothetical protein
MAHLVTFHTLHVSGLFVGEPGLGSLFTLQLPHFQTAMVTMADHIALLAHRDVLLVTLAGQMPHLVTLEAYLLCAFERVMSVLTAQDAV